MLINERLSGDAWHINNRAGHIASHLHQMNHPHVLSHANTKEFYMSGSRLKQ